MQRDAAPRAPPARLASRPVDRSSTTVDLVAAVQQRVDEVRSDEAGSAGHEGSHEAEEARPVHRRWERARRPRTHRARCGTSMPASDQPRRHARRRRARRRSPPAAARRRGAAWPAMNARCARRCRVGPQPPDERGERRRPADEVGRGQQVAQRAGLVAATGSPAAIASAAARPNVSATREGTTASAGAARRRASSASATRPAKRTSPPSAAGERAQRDRAGPSPASTSGRPARAHASIATSTPFSGASRETSERVAARRRRSSLGAGAAPVADDVRPRGRRAARRARAGARRAKALGTTSASACATSRPLPQRERRRVDERLGARRRGSPGARPGACRARGSACSPRRGVEARADRADEPVVVQVQDGARAGRRARRPARASRASGGRCGRGRRARRVRRTAAATSRGSQPAAQHARPPPPRGRVDARSRSSTLRPPRRGARAPATRGPRRRAPRRRACGSGCAGRGSLGRRRTQPGSPVGDREVDHPLKLP